MVIREMDEMREQLLEKRRKLEESAKQVGFTYVSPLFSLSLSPLSPCLSIYFNYAKQVGLPMFLPYFLSHCPPLSSCLSIYFNYLI